jgi:hypothetical protein
VDNLLEPGQVAGVDGDTMVVTSTSLSHKRPVSVLLLEVETGRVRDEDQGKEDTGKSEPTHNPESGLVADVVVDDGRAQGPKLTGSSRKTMGSGSDGDGVHLSGEQESGAVGAKLLEEGRQEVDGLEAVNVGGGLELVKPDGADEETNAVTEEANDLHPLSAVVLVVDQEGSKVVAGEGDEDGHQVPKPARNDVVGRRRGNDLDEGGCEELVSVEKEIVHEPAGSRPDHTATKVRHDELKIVNVITRRVGLGFGVLESVGNVDLLVETVVCEPEGHKSHDTERDTEGPLRRDYTVRGVATTVEDKEKDDEESLVEHLTPSLHEESKHYVPASVKTVIVLVLVADALGLEGRGRGHGVFTTNTYTVEELGEGIADDPALQCSTPRGGEHDETESHDKSVLDQTELSTDPVSLNTDGDLTDNDADNLKIGDSSDPINITDEGLRGTPAVGVNGTEEG